MKQNVVVPLVVALAAAVGVAAGAVSRDLLVTDGPGPASGPEPTTTPTATTDDRLGQPLYWADGVIHDGDLEVPYASRFAIDRLARTASGCAVLDTQADGWLQLVDPSGGTTAVVEADLTNGFDVSADGEEIVFPGPEDNEMTVASTQDGQVLLTLDADLTVDVVHFAGDRFVVGGGDRRESTWVLGEIHVVDRDERVVEVRPGEETKPFWRLVGAHESSGLILATRGTDDDFPRVSDEGELIAFDIDDPARPLWRVPDLTLGDESVPSIDAEPGLGAHEPAGISPDGALIAATPHTGFLFQPDVSVLDAETGETVGEEVLRRDGADSAAWSDDETLLFPQLVPRTDPARFRLHSCARGIDCRAIAGPYRSVQLGTAG